MKYIYTDPEEDPESGSEIRWYKDDIPQTDYDNQLTIFSSATSSGDKWYFTVKTSDGTDFGEIVTSDSITIREDVILPIISSVTSDTVAVGNTVTIKGTGFRDTQDTGYATF